MNTGISVEQCWSFINSQLRKPQSPELPSAAYTATRAITISRQSGCGAHAIAEKLASYLERNSRPPTGPWKVLDRELVERVLEDHQLPARMAKFMPEDRVRQIDDILEELFGVHPPSWALAQQTAETILRLAELGNVIILGRGANVVTAQLPHVLHVRLIGSLERRIQNMRRYEGLGEKAARERIEHEDRGRQRYLKKHYQKDVADPLLYHLVLNTDLVSFDEAARAIGDMALSHQAPSAILAS